MGQERTQSYKHVQTPKERKTATSLSWAVCSSSWQAFHDSGISNILGSPRQCYNFLFRCLRSTLNLLDSSKGLASLCRLCSLSHSKLKLIHSTVDIVHGDYPIVLASQIHWVFFSKEASLIACHRLSSWCQDFA